METKRYPMSALRWRDERQVATALARAFLNDPLVRAICRDASLAHQQERMWWSFRVAIRNHCLAAQPGWVLSDQAGTPAGTVLVSQGQDSGQVLRLGGDVFFALRGFLHIGLRTALRGAEAARLIADQAPPQPFTYLRTLGVVPELQRQGLGSLLVEQVVRAAPAHLPIYLETAVERNLLFYARHGFRCIGEFRCLGVMLWRLLRRAARPLDSPA